MNPNRRFDPEVPVYHAKFADALTKIKDIVKGFNHDLTINQQTRNGVTTSLEVTITLKQ